MPYPAPDRDTGLCPEGYEKVRIASLWQSKQVCRRPCGYPSLGRDGTSGECRKATDPLFFVLSIVFVAVVGAFASE